MSQHLGRPRPGVRTRSVVDDYETRTRPVARSLPEWLFDTSFSAYVTPRVLPVLYGLSLLMAGIYALAIVAVGFSLGSSGVILALFGAPLTFVLLALYTRLFLELSSAVMSTHAKLGAIDRDMAELTETVTGLREGQLGVGAVEDHSSVGGVSSRPKMEPSVTPMEPTAVEARILATLSANSGSGIAVVARGAGLAIGEAQSMLDGLVRSGRVRRDGSGHWWLIP